MLSPRSQAAISATGGTSVHHQRAPPHIAARTLHHRGQTLQRRRVVQVLERDELGRMRDGGDGRCGHLDANAARRLLELALARGRKGELNQQIDRRAVVQDLVLGLRTETEGEVPGR